MIDLHRLLRLTRPLVVTDTETTGVKTDVDRIVELSFQVWTAEDGLKSEWRSLINPGIPIPAEATKIHEITNEVMKNCRECGGRNDEHGPIAERAHAFKPIPTFAQLAKKLAHDFSDCDFAGKNVRFDLRILAAEFRRAGVAWSYAEARIVDAERLEQIAVPRTLSHLHEKYVGHKHDGAHGALADVQASTAVIAAQLRTHDALPRDLDQLHELQWDGWIDPDGRFRFKNGVPVVTFGKYAGQPMSSVMPDYWQFILRSDFPPDTKTIAERALRGEFPKKRTAI